MTFGAKRIQGLDVLRGVAVGLVILQHALPAKSDEHLSLGIVGVVIFFALSGYLITGILHRDITTGGRVRYGRFYRNRALRLLPPLVAMLAVFAIVELAFSVLTDSLSHLAKGVFGGLFYVADLPPFYSWMRPGLTHLWTLAVEEQFYFVWPIALLLLVRWGVPRAGVVVLIVLSVAVTCALCVMKLDTDVAILYKMPTTWAPALLIGCAAQLNRDRLARLGTLGVWHLVGAAVLVASLFLTTRDSAVTYTVGAVLIGAATIPFIMWLATITTVHSAARPLLALGTVSYAAYLWNYTVTQWLTVSFGYTAVTALLGVVLTVAAATLSWHSVERWARTVRARADSTTSGDVVRPDRQASTSDRQ